VSTGSWLLGGVAGHGVAGGETVLGRLVLVDGGRHRVVLGRTGGLGKIFTESSDLGPGGHREDGSLTLPRLDRLAQHAVQ